MSRRELIDPEVRVPLDQLLEALPGGFNAIPDIVQRRATVEAMLAGMEVPDNPNVAVENPSSRIKLALSQSGSAPHILRSLTVPLTARVPMSPPG